MNVKQALFTLLLLGIASGGAAEIKFDRSSDWAHEGGKVPRYANGAFQLGGVVHLFARRMVDVEPGKRYTLTAEFRSSSRKRLPGICVAVVFVGAKGERIPATQYMAFDRTENELAAPTALTDSVIKVKKHPTWKLDKNIVFAVAFDVKADKSDLPNAKVSTPVKAIEADGELLKVTLEKPLYATFPAGTKVRLHRKGSFYQPCPDGVYYNWAAPEWKKVGGTVRIPAGAKKFFPAIIYYDWRKNTTATFEMRNAVLTVD